ncbi:MAG: peroxiredoxin [Thermoplasmata archaeon]
MIGVGDVAPDFEGLTSEGKTLHLSTLRGRTVVLYFYPKAGSYGCTRESIEFAHLYPSLRARGADVVGVSVDDEAGQHRFAEECHLPFPLVADHEKSVSRLYGVLGAFGLAKRVTFVIDPQGRVSNVTTGMNPGPHVRAVSEELLADPT